LSAAFRSTLAALWVKSMAAGTPAAIAAARKRGVSTRGTSRNRARASTPAPKNGLKSRRSAPVIGTACGHAIDVLAQSLVLPHPLWPPMRIALQCRGRRSPSHRLPCRRRGQHCSPRRHRHYRAHHHRLLHHRLRLRHFPHLLRGHPRHGIAILSLSVRKDEPGRIRPGLRDFSIADSDRSLNPHAFTLHRCIGIGLAS
jgi:hypothetical protein